MASPVISYGPLQPKDRDMKSGYSHLLDATQGNAAQVQSPWPPAPGSAIPRVGETNEPVLHKRKRRPYGPQRRPEVAAVRKVGACEECRQKKTRCPHALQPQPTNEFAIQGTTPRLQSSTPQDLSTVFGLCGASPVRPSDDSPVMTSVSVTTFNGANQFSPHQGGRLDSIIDNRGHSHLYADQKLDSFFPRSIDSQITSCLRTPENGQTIVAPASMPRFPGENEPWQLKTGREVKQAWRSRCNERLQSSVAHRNTNQQELAASQASPPGYGFLVASPPSYSHRYRDAPTQISEITSENSQIGIPCLVRRNPPFATSHSSSPGAHIAPGDLYYNSMVPEGLEALPPGPFDNIAPRYVANAIDLMSPNALLSQHSPAPSDQDKIFNDSGRNCLLKPVHGDNAILGTNFALGCNCNTLGGCGMPLSSTIGAGFMLTRPHDVAFPQGFLPSNQIANSSNNFTIPGHRTGHDVGNSNLAYVQSHDTFYSSFPSDDFESFSFSRGPPSARHNCLPYQIRPHEESTFYSSRPSLISPNFQSGHPPLLPQPPNVWANAPIPPHIWHSTTSKEEGGFKEYDVIEEEDCGYEYDGVSPIPKSLSPVQAVRLKLFKGLRLV